MILNNPYIYPMKTALCTISTQSHLFKSFALFDSVMPFSGTDLCCLVTDANHHQLKEGVVFHHLHDLTADLAQTIQQKYTNDKLRWSLKPVYVQFLLEQGYDRVIYVDNDIFFFSSPDFLFEKLAHSSFLLTPHFYKADPTKEQNWLEANFRVGLYNAGFFGANKNAVPALEWWAECCVYEVKKVYWRGLFDDQKYLDLVPVQFDDVEIVKHTGCNLAGWNDWNYWSKEDESVVFIHFAELTMEKFSVNTHVLNKYYHQYISALKKYQANFEWKKNRRSVNYFRNALYYLRWKLSSN